VRRVAPRTGAGPEQPGTVGALQGILAAGLCMLGSCTGIFQRSLPDKVAEFHMVATGKELRVGSAERDITPLGRVYMGGFDLGRVSTGIVTPLKARAMVFELGGECVVVLGVDNLGVMREDTDWIKGGITGVKNGCIFLCSSHTHAGPDLIGMWGFYFMNSGRDPLYVAQVRIAVAAAVAEARARAQPADLWLGQARLPARGLVQNSKRNEVFDRDLVVLQARAKSDGMPLGSLLHLACHPEVLRRANTLLSADYVGELCDAWVERGHGQAVFCNGAIGAMVTPGIPERDLRGMRQMGRDLCSLAEQALAAARILPVDEIEVKKRDVFLSLDTLAFELGRLTMVLQRELYGGCARSTVGYLRLGKLEIAGVPGEMEPVEAQRLRDRSHRPDLLVFGLCDDELGYLMREVDAANPRYHYERSMSPCLRAGDIAVEALVGK
jgi:hypothetical protein